MQRADISRLKRNYALHFKIGMIISISLVALAFQWTTSEPDYSDTVTEALYTETVVEVVRTVFEKPPQLPPPTLKVSEQFIEEDIEFIEEPLPEKLDPVITSSAEIKAPVKMPEVTFEKPAQTVLIEEPKIEEIFIVVEQMPRFKGCEEMEGSSEEKELCANQLMLKYIYSKISYPKVAREMGLEGTVNVRFVVEKNGSISNIEILRDIGGGCGQQVVDIVKGMPDWLPGKQRGNPVRVQFNLPVQYKLN